MKTKFLLFSALLMLFVSWQGYGQTTIAQQDFETSPGTPTLTFLNTGGAFSTGNGLFPAAPKFVSGSRGFEVSNGTAILTFSSLNTSNYSSVSLSFRLASFAGTSGNGADGADEVKVEISTNGGANFSSEAVVSGNNNAKWSFTSGTGTFSSAYDGNVSPTTIAPTSGGNVTTQGYSTVTLSNITPSPNLVVRITMTNNAANETWVMDDVSVSGTLAPSPTISLSDNGTQVSVGNINQGAINRVLSRTQMAVTANPANLNEITFVTSGTYVAADFLNFKLRYSTDATLDAADAILSTLTTIPLSGSTVTFPSLSQQVAQNATGYFFITADADASAVAGNTIAASAPTYSVANANVASNVMTAGGTQTILAVTPTVVIADNGAPIAVGNISQNTTNNLLAAFQLSITTANADLDGLTITTTGSYIASDVSNLQLWYSTDNSFDAGSDVSLNTISSPTIAGNQVFTSFNRIITNGTTGYFFITINNPCVATSGNIIQVSAISNTDVSFNGTASVSGSASQSGSKTIQTVTPNAVTAVNAAAGNTNASIAWTNPICFDDVIVVAHTATITGTPSGSYTVSSQSFTDAANPVFPLGGKVVYSGTISPQTIIDLTNSTQYFFKVFTRKGSNYSAGVEVMATPSATTNINFDNNANWTNGSSAITSYATDHSYSESNWTFTGDRALRNGTSQTDNFAGAKGTYSWRLQNNNSVVWTGTYTAALTSGQSFTQFGFSARRWDDSPSVNFLVEYSFDSGTTYTTATSFGASGALNNTGLNNQSDFLVFTQSITGPAALAANQMIIRVSAQGATERLMIDDFSFVIGSSSSTTYTYNNAWNIDPSSLATTSDNIVIAAGKAPITTNTICKDLTISPGAKLSISTGNTLTVNGTATLEASNAGYAQVLGEIATAGSGSIKWQSHLKAVAARWFNVGVPVATTWGNASLSSGLIQTTGNDATTNLWYYDAVTKDPSNADGTWTRVANKASQNTNDRGYSLYLGGSNFGALPITVEVSGTILNDGNQAISNITNANRGYNFISNPYPSVIDWDAIQAANTDLQTTYYIYDDANSTYVGYNSGAGALPGGVTAVTQYIAPGQAYFVQNLSGTNNLTVNFTNAMRDLDATAPSLYKTTATGLFLVVDGVGKTDYTYVGFNNAATDGIERMDAEKFQGGDINLQSSLNGVDFMYNFVSNQFSNKRMEVSFDAASNGTYNIDPDFRNIPAGWAVTLEDKAANTTTDLRSGAYSFSHTIGNQTGRFVLHINKNGSSVGVDEQALNNIFAYTSNTMLHINLEQVKGIATITMFDVNGRKVAETNASGGAVADINMIDVAQGVYIAKVSQAGMEVFTQKVIR